MYKKLLAIVLIFLPVSVLAAPTARYELNLYPFFDSAYDLGTSTNAWSSATLDKLWVTGLSGSGTRCVQVDNAGLFAVAGAACGSGGSGGGGLASSTPWTANLFTYVIDDASLGASSTPYFANYHFTNATGTNLNLTSLSVTPLTSALLQTNTVGTFSEYGGTSCTNQFVRALSALGVATCADVGTADVTDGVLLEADLKVVDSPADEDILTFESTGGDFEWHTCAEITGSADLCDGNDASGAGGTPYPFPLATNATSSLTGFYGGILTTASSTHTGSTTLFTTLMTNATATEFAVTNNFIMSGITSAIPLTSANGQVSEYAGTSCTNQFVRSLSALGAATCATVVAADVSLANLSATDSTLTFSGTYNGGTARTIGLNLGNANVWTAGQTFTSSTTLQAFTGTNYLALSSTTLQTYSAANGVINLSFALPQGTGPTVDAAGEIAVDTNTDQLLYFGASSSPIVIQRYDNIGFAYATTSWSATTTLRIGPSPANISVKSAYCETNAGTVDVSLYDGTNRAALINTASTTINRYDYGSTNTSFTAGESMRVDIGNPASSPTSLSCRFLYIYDRQ